MISIENKSKCCGCMACFNACPKAAIFIVEDEKGFKYPKVNREKCIECSICEKVCPIINQSTKGKIEDDFVNYPKAYACINMDKDIREKSSSGGIFTLLAEKIIKCEGVVFGAAFDVNFRVRHIVVDNLEDLKKLRGSKYVQSNIGDSYKKVKKFLEIGKKVLFTGTGCQIEGLKSYLNKDYDNLFLQDVICHGVPSPKVWERYKRFQEENESSKINDIFFREKINGWDNYNVRINFKNNNVYRNSNRYDMYMRAFLEDIILRDSCYECSFKKKNRVADITLADFWGIDNVAPDMNDNKGTSLLMIHSKKGEELFSSILDKIKYKEVEFEEAINYNQSMIKSAPKSKYITEFFDNLEKIGFEELVKKYVEIK